ncbi:MAG: FAD:protein FMN transferase [Alphaproteobacteria bacterium]|nr:FAD:protein FMN transferase [Alphaproteobacteria bacterium]
MPVIERAKPLLGTIVRIRVAGLSPDAAHRAIDSAFAEIGTIHHLMSFHEDDSDVSRLNRDAHANPIEINARTHAVLAQALTLSSITAGAFDVAVAAELVERDVLPRRSDLPATDGDAPWTDIVLLDKSQVRFRKPLWIDLGGIAKGYAVDCAVDFLLETGATQVCVNAGGDLRVAGPDIERVRLAPEFNGLSIPVVELSNGSLASSSGTMAARRCGTATGMPHVAPRNATPTLDQFVSVIAPRCIHADALTKAVMAKGARTHALLARFGARAIVHNLTHGWREIGRPV